MTTKELEYYVRTPSQKAFKAAQLVAFTHGFNWPTSSNKVLDKADFHYPTQVIVFSFTRKDITYSSLQLVKHNFIDADFIEITLDILKLHFSGVITLPSYMKD